jgi:hypothetical protein
MLGWLIVSAKVQDGVTFCTTDRFAASGVTDIGRRS